MPKIGGYANFLQVCSIALCRALQILWSLLVLKKLEVCDSTVSSESVSTVFPPAFPHVLSLGHILVILTIPQAFSLLLCLLW